VSGQLEKRGTGPGENLPEFPITGQAYWFDSSGILRADYAQPRTVTYTDFRSWKSKLIPYRVEAYENGSTVSSIQLDSLTDLSENSDCQFTIDAVTPAVVVNPGDYEGPVFVKSRPIQVKPEDQHAGHGTVVGDVQLDYHGHVRAAQVRKSAGPELDPAALQAALQWEFSPTYLRGRAVPGSTVLQFQF
jgi:TonB family protein